MDVRHVPAIYDSSEYESAFHGHGFYITKIGVLGEPALQRHLSIQLNVGAANLHIGDLHVLDQPDAWHWLLLFPPKPIKRIPSHRSKSTASTRCLRLATAASKRAGIVS